MAVRDTRHNSDHIMVIGCLRYTSPRKQLCFPGHMIHLSLQLPVRHMRTRADKIFSELGRLFSKADKRVARHNSWISAETWRIVDKRDSSMRVRGRNLRRLRRLGQTSRASLKQYRRCWTASTREDVERLLRGYPPHPQIMEEDTGLLQSGGGPGPVTCHLLESHLRGSRWSAWNSIASYPPPPPPFPPGDTITTSRPRSQIDNSVPIEEEVKWEVWRLRGHRSGGPYWMHHKHLQKWLQKN